MAQVVRCQPSTLQELKDVVEDFASNIDPAKVRSMVRHARYRAELCVAEGGGHIEHLVKKSGRRDSYRNQNLNVLA